MIRVELSEREHGGGIEKRTWGMKRPMPKSAINVKRIIELTASGMELDTIMRDISGIKKATYRDDAGKLHPFTPQTWYGDDAKFIWAHFKENYQA